MNKHILVAMDRKNRTKEQLSINVNDAAVAADVALAAYNSAKHASFSADAVNAANAANAAASDHDDTERCLDEYFEVTGENKQDYIDAIEASK